VTVAGIVLAAGAGTRFGGPKSLAADPDGTLWLPRAVQTLRDGGCETVIAILGASAVAARALLDDTVVVTIATAWSTGISASIAAGLDAASEVADIDAVAIVPVDVPSLSAAMVARVVGATPVEGDALRRASFSGRPGHPVVIGRNHWSSLAAHLAAQPDPDAGARDYLAAHGVLELECSDLGSGDDVDAR
jgi:CTP:molybdopterin cytidylyltransferase MocA